MEHVGRWFVTGSDVVVSILLSLKLLQMIDHTVEIRRIPSSVVDQLGDAVTSERKLTLLLQGCRRAWDPRLWVFTKIVLRLPDPLRGPSRLIFRWPSLMTAQALLLVLGRQRATTEVGCVLLVAGVWVELAQRFLSRLRLGYFDTYFRRISENHLYPEFQREFSAPHNLDLVTDFIFLVGRMVAVVIIAYAAVYSALELSLSPGAFVGSLGQGLHVVLALLYFSIVTIATVGYGDIYPRTDWARLLVASEILAGLLLLVLLITAFALTASPPPEQRNTRSLR